MKTTIFKQTLFSVLFSPALFASASLSVDFERASGECLAQRVSHTQPHACPLLDFFAGLTNFIDTPNAELESLAQHIDLDESKRRDIFNHLVELSEPFTADQFPWAHDSLSGSDELSEQNVSTFSPEKPLPNALELMLWANIVRAEQRRCPSITLSDFWDLMYENLLLNFYAQIPQISVNVDNDKKIEPRAKRSLAFELDFSLDWASGLSQKAPDAQPEFSVWSTQSSGDELLLVDLINKKNELLGAIYRGDVSCSSTEDEIIKAQIGQLQAKLAMIKSGHEDLSIDEITFIEDEISAINARIKGNRSLRRQRTE